MRCALTLMYNSQFMNSKFIFSTGLTRDFFERRMEMCQVSFDA